jgi:dsRNA-specific ribonuclease
MFTGFPSFQKMSAAAVGKTPVSVLQELLSRRGTTPKYELVQIEGAIHEPTFRYRVTVADVVGMYDNTCLS